MKRKVYGYALYVLLFTTVLISLQACDISGVSTTQQELDLLQQNKEKWDTKGFKTYNLFYSCCCVSICYTDYDLISVVDDVAVEGWYYGTSVPAEPLTQQELNDAILIHESFDILKKAILDGKEIKVEYDSTYGFPTKWDVCDSGCPNLDYEWYTYSYELVNYDISPANAPVIFKGKGFR